MERRRWDEIADTSKFAFCHRKSNKHQSGEGEVAIISLLAGGEREMGMRELKQAKSLFSTERSIRLKDKGRGR